jgi:uncharacterized membrane protein
MERHIRTIVKTLSWRILATSTTLLLVYVFTGSIVISASVSFMEIVIKTIIYYLHERMWSNINFGKDRSPTKAILAKTPVLAKQGPTKKGSKKVNYSAGSNGYSHN